MKKQRKKHTEVNTTDKDIQGDRCVPFSIETPETEFT
ncbi:hypothetical protein R3I93_000564 [Phoxinus phoxinus]|uniref:Uncharacterized protein n=1 Tax=Phoxinus phoxinus TaxID=58324 RepID=A0AAN9HKX2_9TELE